MQNLTSQILGYAEQCRKDLPFRPRVFCISEIVLQSTRPFRG